MEQINRVQEELVLFIDACRMHYIIEKAENDSRSRKVVIDKQIISQMRKGLYY